MSGGRTGSLLKADSDSLGAYSILLNDSDDESDQSLLTESPDNSDDELAIQIARELNAEFDTQAGQADFLEIREDTPATCSSSLTTKLRVLMYFIPLVNSGIEAIQTSYGLQDRAPGLKYTTTAVGFLSAFALSAKFTVGGMDDTYQFIRTRRIPEDWPYLPRNKEYTAAAISVFTIACVSLSDAAQAWYFVQQMPQEYDFKVDTTLWMIPTAAIAFTTFGGFLFSEGLETYKAMREILSPTPYRYANEFSRYTSQIAMASFGYFGAVNDIVVSYLGVKEVLGVSQAPLTCVIGSISLLNGVTDFSMNARYIRDSLDATIAHLNQNSIKKTDVVAFMLAAAGAGLLSYAGQSFIEAFWEMLFEELSIEMGMLATGVIAVQSWGGAAYYFASYTPSLFPYSYWLTNKAGERLSAVYDLLDQKIKATYEKIASQLPCRADPELGAAPEELVVSPADHLPKTISSVESTSEVEETTPFLDAETIPARGLSGNTSAFFARDNKRAKEEKPSGRCQIGCNIL